MSKEKLCDLSSCFDALLFLLSTCFKGQKMTVSNTSFDALKKIFRPLKKLFDTVKNLIGYRETGFHFMANGTCQKGERFTIVQHVYSPIRWKVSYSGIEENRHNHLFTRLHRSALAERSTQIFALAFASGFVYRSAKAER